jgi:hypothetical protein
VKTPEQIVREVTTRLRSCWHEELAPDQTVRSRRWPYRIALGAPTSTAADQSFGEVIRWAHRWHDWSGEHHVTLTEQTRRIRSVEHCLPTHLVVPDLDTAGRLAGPEWARRIERGRQRHAAIAHQLPQCEAARAIRLADPLNDTDFTLALRAAQWLTTTPTTQWQNLTPRQVPIAGLHAKWLDTHSQLVRALAGLDELALRQRPTRVYWTYLDPTYRDTGARVHDSLTLGDYVPLPYAPDVVLIVENKDTAVMFPPLARGIVVEGNGNAGVGLLPQIDWIRSARAAIYWGDIDQRGYEIVNGLRARLPQLRTMLMDLATYDAYHEFGTEFEPNGKPVKLRPRMALAHLTSDERDVYDSLSDPDWLLHRRFEQERIPLCQALAHVQTILEG